MTEQPPEKTFLIDEVVGVSNEEYGEIIANIHRLADSGMDMPDVVKEVMKGRNPYDVMVGIKLATLLYMNEGRL